jgi:hypothetical protein
MPSVTFKVKVVADSKESKGETKAKAKPKEKMIIMSGAQVVCSFQPYAYTCTYDAQ